MLGNKKNNLSCHLAPPSPKGALHPPPLAAGTSGPQASEGPVSCSRRDLGGKLMG